ncbi:MAG: hypothetical protein PVF83_13405 [Anaerolineales bacterium]|jgi:hypothetical protein
MTKKQPLLTLASLFALILLTGCAGRAVSELVSLLDAHPPVLAMPYQEPDILPGSLPPDLPFPFTTLPGGELLGSVVDGDGRSGTVLLVAVQSPEDILAYYTPLLSASSFMDTTDARGYNVFFPAQGSSATFCSGQARAVILKIYPREDGANDVHLHYTTDEAVIADTTCAEPILAIEDFPFPTLPALPSASDVAGSRGGGGGGGGQDYGQVGPLGYTAETFFTSSDDLEAVHRYYQDLLAGEGWIMLEESTADDSVESSWDFGYYQTRSWLARLIVSTGDEPDQYRVEFRAVSP